MNFAAISQKIAGSGDNTTPMQIRKNQPGTDLHRRVVIVGPCCGRAMLAPTHGYAPVGRTVLVRMYVRTELFRNSYTFFSASIRHLTIIRHPL